MQNGQEELDPDSPSGFLFWATLLGLACLVSSKVLVAGAPDDPVMRQGEVMFTLMSMLILVVGLAPAVWRAFRNRWLLNPVQREKLKAEAVERELRLLLAKREKARQDQVAMDDAVDRQVSAKTQLRELEATWFDDETADPATGSLPVQTE